MHARRRGRKKKRAAEVRKCEQTWLCSPSLSSASSMSPVRRENNTPVTRVFLEVCFFFWYAADNCFYYKSNTGCLSRDKLRCYLCAAQGLSCRGFLKFLSWSVTFLTQPSRPSLVFQCRKMKTSQWAPPNPAIKNLLLYHSKSVSLAVFLLPLHEVWGQVSAQGGRRLLRSLHCTLIFSIGPTIIQVR